MTSHEVNFDGIVGPTHNYAGLAFGNLAAMKNKGRKSNPKMAALEGLAKMKFLLDLGIKQAVLPPHERPDTRALRQLGFTGSDADILAAARKNAPHILAACSSASAMWTANAATISPSTDTLDGRVHITPANLVSQLHRSFETATTARVLKTIFADEFHFAHHAPLPAALSMADEGAANHMRLAQAGLDRGLQIFVHGRHALAIKENTTNRFAPRQTLEASESVARSHSLNAPPIFLRQNPAAIDAGAFHNDVVAVAHENVLLYHPQAWANGAAAVQTIRRRAKAMGMELVSIEINARQISLSDAIKSYLFNSQIVTLPDGSMALIAPAECRRVPSARRFLDWLPNAGTPIRRVHFVPVRQSMRNGGGPACLRLRVVLNDRELARTHSGVLLTSSLYDHLTAWVNRHYRDQLAPDDLADPSLLEESRRALDELSRILRVGSIYDFQK
jgi:succinylarginine dihydrolase